MDSINNGNLFSPFNSKFESTIIQTIKIHPTKALRYLSVNRGQRESFRLSGEEKEKRIIMQRFRKHFGKRIYSVECENYLPRCLTHRCKDLRNLDAGPGLLNRYPRSLTQLKLTIPFRHLRRTNSARLKQALVGTKHLKHLNLNTYYQPSLPKVLTHFRNLQILRLRLQISQDPSHYISLKELSNLKRISFEFYTQFSTFGPDIPTGRKAVLDLTEQGLSRHNLEFFSLEISETPFLSRENFTSKLLNLFANSKVPNWKLYLGDDQTVLEQIKEQHSVLERLDFLGLSIAPQGWKLNEHFLSDEMSQLSTQPQKALYLSKIKGNVEGLLEKCISLKGLYARVENPEVVLRALRHLNLNLKALFIIPRRWNEQEDNFGVGNVENLETFEYHCFNIMETAQPILKRTFYEAFEQMINLRNLHIAIHEQNFGTLSKIIQSKNQLQKLSISLPNYQIHPSEELVNILQQLPKLQRLVIDASFPLEVNDIKRLIDIVGDLHHLEIIKVESLTLHNIGLHEFKRLLKVMSTLTRLKEIELNTKLAKEEISGIANKTLDDEEESYSGEKIRIKFEQDIRRLFDVNKSLRTIKIINKPYIFYLNA